jgi:hypothetical protein
LESHFTSIRHPGEGRDLYGASQRHGEIPAFAGMTIQITSAVYANAAPHAKQRPRDFM